MKKQKTKEDIHRFSVFFNDEYIGEADSFKVKKGKKDLGIEVMPILELKGNFSSKKKIILHKTNDA